MCKLENSFISNSLNCCLFIYCLLSATIKSLFDFISSIKAFLLLLTRRFCQRFAGAVALLRNCNLDQF